MTKDLKRTLLAVAGICTVLVLVALDQTVVATALPTIVSELNGFELYAWVGTSYLLASVITIPIMGKLGDEYGRKPLVVAATIVFGLASILCGLSETMLQLVLARVAQGVGGGMLIATAFAAIPDLFPKPADRLHWQVFFSAAFGVANAFGPSLGGFLAEYWGWRWVFFINIPFSAVALYFVHHHLPLIKHHDHKPARLDYVGAALMATALGTFQLLVEWIPQNKGHYTIMVLAIIAVTSAVLLVWWEGRVENPILPLQMFTHSHLAPVFALSLLAGMGMFGMMFFAPLLFQGGLGLSPKLAGILVTPLAVGVPVGTIINSKLVPKLDYPNPMLWTGFTLLFVNVTTLALTTSATPLWLIFIAMSMGGIGLGFILPNLTLISQAQAKPQEIGVVTAIGQTLRMVGSMVGTALIGTIVTNYYAHGITDTIKDPAVRHWLIDPQLLVNPALAHKFIDAIGATNAQAYLLSAEHSLVTAVHMGQWLLLGFVVLALVAMFWLPKSVIKGLKAEVSAH